MARTRKATADAGEESTPSAGGESEDHSALAGLADDDAPQYSAGTDGGVEVVSQPSAPAEVATPEKDGPPPDPNRLAKPLTVASPNTNAPDRRNLGGKYECLTRVSVNGKIVPPGTVLKLDDRMARHYLAGYAVKALD